MKSRPKKRKRERFWEAELVRRVVVSTAMDPFKKSDGGSAPTKGTIDCWVSVKAIVGGRKSRSFGRFGGKGG